MKSHRTSFRKNRRAGQSSKRRPNAWQFETLENRSLLSGSDWQNPANALDVTNDGKVSALDALTIVNDLNSHGARRLLASSGGSALAALAFGGTSTQGSPLAGGYLDVSGDGLVTPQDMLLVANALNADPPSVRIRLQATDLNGVPINAIAQGEDFLIKAFVQDLRLPESDTLSIANKSLNEGSSGVTTNFVFPVTVSPSTIPSGVFTAYLDVDFDADKNKVSIESDAVVTFGADYGNFKNSDLTTAGKILETGAGAGLNRLDGAERLLWSIPAHADALGHVNFDAQPATDDGHEVLLFDEADPVPTDPPDSQVEYLDTFIDVIAPGTATLSINDVSANEGNAGTTNFVFTVTRSSSSGQSTVNFSTAVGTASATDDFNTTSGVLTFANGVTTQPITVTVKGDTVRERDETFVVNLSNATNAAIADARGVGTIVNDEAVFVNFATANDTATAPGDYATTSGTLTFAPGVSTQNITVGVVSDGTAEPDETFNVNLSAPVNAVINDGQAVGTIKNDDVATGPSLSINGVTAAEGNSGTTNFVFTVTLAQGNGQSVNVNFTTNAGTASTPGDFAPLSGILTFAAGVTTQQVTVAVQGDLLNEANETFAVDLSGAVGATIIDGHGVGTINNDDALPSLTIGDVSLTEGNSGTKNFVFAVSLAPGSGQQVKVNFATSNGTATAGSDYGAASGTLTFDPGTTTQNITVVVNGDTSVESNETFTVTLSTPINATIADATGTGTIQDDDTVAQPSISINDVFRPEGNSGTSNAVFSVTLSASSTQQVKVAFATANGSAVAPADYTATSGTLTFNAGTTTQTITVAVKGDTLNESDENFFVNLSAPTNATISDAQGQGTIQDDDAQPTISIGDVTLNEGNSGTTNFVFAVTLSGASGNNVTVNFATADGTASAPSDYTSNSGVLTFAAGETTKNVTVGVKGDAINEPNETFFVNLSAASGATILDNQGLGTITNDDTGPGISVADVTLAEGQSSTTNFVFTVSLSPTSGQQVTVAFATANGTATAGSDYTASSGTLTFAPGIGSQQVTVAVNGDTLSEANETFFLNLSNPVNAAIADNQAVGTITNDDALPTLSINDVSLDEGNSGTTNFVFTVTMSAVSGQQVTVNFATADGNSATTSDNARAPSDYTATSGTLTFAEGSTTKTITVAVKGDLFFESNQNFLVNLTGAAGATLADGQGVGTIVNDDEEGNVEPSNFSGVVYVDTNNNGVQDNGENGIANVTVHLTGTSEAGDPIDEQTTTGDDGKYEFVDIPPGDYHITQTQPAFFLQGHDTIGTDGTFVVQTNQFGTTFEGGEDSTGNNFGERGLRPEFISKRGFLASTPSTNTALTALSLAAGPAWFSFDAGWDGLLTAQANGGANLDLTLYDANLHALATSSPGGARLDYQGLVGQPYFLRVGGSGTNVDLTLTNVVHQVGDTVTIRGTAADDDFQFIAGAKNTVIVNGTSYQFDPVKVKSIVFDGGDGTNSVTLTGSAGNDVADLHLGSGSLIGAGYNVSASNVNSMAINSGGGNDTATLHDSALSDHLSADGDWLSLANDLGFAASVQGFSRVRASSTAGGTDTLDIQAINFVFEHDGPWLG